MDIAKIDKNLAVEKTVDRTGLKIYDVLESPFKVYATTSLYKYEPGSEFRIICGAVDGHNFMYANDQLICELVDPGPIKGGHVGFSPHSTALMIKDIEIREIYWEKFEQMYEPEF